MKSSKFGVHEVIDLREISNFKVACLAKAKSRVNQVENTELKYLVEQSIEAGTKSVQAISDLLSTASAQLNQ